MAIPRADSSSSNCPTAGDISPVPGTINTVIDTYTLSPLAFHLDDVFRSLLIRRSPYGRLSGQGSILGGVPLE
jgi:hypothetical protein